MFTKGVNQNLTVEWKGEKTVKYPSQPATTQAHTSAKVIYLKVLGLLSFQSKKCVNSRNALHTKFEFVSMNASLPIGDCRMNIQPRKTTRHNMRENTCFYAIETRVVQIYQQKRCL